MATAKNKKKGNRTQDEADTSRARSAWGPSSRAPALLTLVARQSSRGRPVNGPHPLRHDDDVNCRRKKSRISNLPSGHFVVCLLLGDNNAFMDGRDLI
ncbi:hypothetical protein B296_00049376 [Ensete ventricosum]|uniref:Uncharacterized protein n=1 Tax=Ensete ventricosum TaxID=4639 RepID=A0A426XAV8_ENSVE|nr:hypothetical protein B296_00049376 [Ensete ventricosum]